MGLTPKPQGSVPKNHLIKEIRIRCERLNSDLLPASSGHGSLAGAKRKKVQNSLRIAQWNLRGLSHPSKIQTINIIDCDLLALQEINHLNSSKIDLINTKSVILRKERKLEERGGGTMTLSDLNISHTEEINVNKDCNLLRLIIDGVFVVWIGNIYLNLGLPKQINKLFSAIQSNIPEHEMKNLILIGDFNVNLNNKSPKLTLLTNLCKQFNLKIHNPGQASREHTTLDFLISGGGIEASLKDNLRSCSDHNILIWDISFGATTKPKKIYIPNRKLAEEITKAAVMDKDVTNAVSLLERFLKLKKLRKKEQFLRIKPKKVKNDEYKNLLLSLKEEDSIKETLNFYWTNFWEELEAQRYSPMSKEAFDTLKAICKYHLYEKRDGSIVNKILTCNGEILTDPKKVASSLIEVLKDIQLSEKFVQYSGNLPFPDLPPLTEGEVWHLLSKLATGKALSFDLFSDMLLKDESAMKKLTKLLKDLWSKDLNKIDSLNELFKARLVALNKVHPNIPKQDEFRPIIILSLIIKIMECRWLPKLQEYVITKLCPSQTGFVPGQGVFTNIFRAIKRIKERTSKKQRIFGLFIDFKSAYNFARHDLLFERLEKMLDKDEINFQRAIYDKIMIQLETSMFRPNLGVAQGSVISPFLFDIYTEPLLLELSKILGVDDILAYADDILILCENQSLLHKCIDIIERWSHENNLKINKKKSAVLEFINRRNRITQLNLGESFRGYPVVDKYKYLGTWLSQKLTADPQIQFLEKKVNFMKHKLSPCLYNASLDMRKNMWQVFVLPLFEFTLPIYFYEEAVTRKLRLEKILRHSFKSFTGLGKTVETKLIDELMGYSLQARSKHIQYVSEKKWEFRLIGEQYFPTKDPNQELAWSPYKPNKCKYFSKDMIKFINLQCAICPTCKDQGITKRCSQEHLDTFHQVKIDSVDIIYDHLIKNSMKEVVNSKNKKVKKPKNRKEMIQTFHEIFDPNYYKIKSFFCQ